MHTKKRLKHLRLDKDCLISIMWRFLISQIAIKQYGMLNITTEYSKYKLFLKNESKYDMYTQKK